MKNLPKIAGLIFVHGTFAKPFLNMLLDSKLDQTWREYFSTIRHKWDKDYKKALKSSKAGLRRLKRIHGDSGDFDERHNSGNSVFRRYVKDKTLYYLLLMEELSIQMKYPGVETDEIFKKLESSYSRMPQLPREMAKSIFLNYHALMKKGKFKPRGGKVEPQAQVFVMIGNAKTMMKEGSFSKAFSLFNRAAKIAKKIPHPSGFVGCLNDMAWYTMGRHPRVACGIGKKAVYWGGWYKENISDIFYIVDTLFEIQLDSKDAGVQKTCELIAEADDLLPAGKGWGTKEYYEKLLERSSAFVPDYKSSSYENTPDLKGWIKKFGSITEIHKKTGISRANLYSILNGKTRTVRGETLKKILGSMTEDPDFDVPFAVFNECNKIKAERDFERSMEIFGDLTEEERRLSVISTYSAKISRRKSLPYLSRKGTLKKMCGLCHSTGEFREFAAARYETMNFVNDSFSGFHPFFEARRDLVKEFFGRLSDEKRRIFMAAYAASDNERMEIGDQIMRNYVRYDIEWGIKLKVPDEIKNFSEKYDLDETLATIAFWAMEKNVMKNFLKLKRPRKGKASPRKEQGSKDGTSRDISR